MKRILILIVAFLVIGLSLFFLKNSRAANLNKNSNTTQYYYNIYKNHVFFWKVVDYESFQYGIKYYEFVKSLKVNSNMFCASLGNEHEKIIVITSGKDYSLLPLLFFMNAHNFSKFFVYVLYNPINLNRNFPVPYFLKNKYFLFLINNTSYINIFEGFLYNNGEYESFFIRHGHIYTENKNFGIFNQTMIKAMFYAYFGYLWKNYLITFNNSSNEKELIIELKNITLIYHLKNHRLLYVDVRGYISGRFYPCSFNETPVSIYEQAFKNTSRNGLKIYGIYKTKPYSKNFILIPKYIENFIEKEYYNG